MSAEEAQKPKTDGISAGENDPKIASESEKTADITVKKEKPSGIPSFSKIARPCAAGQAKIATNPTSNGSGQIKNLTDDFSKHTLTDVQEENEEDNLPPLVRKTRRMSSSSWDNLWEYHHPLLTEAGLDRHSDNTILTEDTDSFIIGDRIWVSGTKPGQIAYIGDTQFAPGEWAGIVLDKPIGKNDGSVAGVRYFQCPAKRGVFSRLTRLTRTPLPGADLEDVSPPHSVRSHSMTPPPPLNGVRRRQSPISPTGSSAGLRKSPPSLCNSNTSLASSHVCDFKIGDRVIIKSTQGSKVGTLRFMGTTDFAPGEWCGVELDDPKGKNDGSVEGKRYFECRPNFGLFAPIHKVSKSPMKYRPGTENCAIHSGAGLPPSGIRRAGSRESMNSMSSSMISNTPSTRRKTPGKTTTTTTTFHTRTQTLQDVLREKQLHIEQLLKERDLERGEITKAANQADEAEHKLTLLKNEYEKYRLECESKLKEFAALISAFKKEKDELVSQLDDERRKNEDLQFTFEEAAITKGDIEVTNEKMLANIRELEKQLGEERQKIELLESESNKLFETTETLTKAREEVEFLKTQLNTSNNSEQIKDLTEKLQETQKELENSLKQYKQVTESWEKKLQSLEAAHKDTEVKLASELQETKLKLESIELASELKNSEMNLLITELNDTKSTLNITIKDNETKQAELLKNFEKLKLELSAKIADVEILTDVIKEKDSQIAHSNSELQCVKNQILQFDGNEHSFKKEIDNLKEQLKEKIALKEESDRKQQELDKNLEKIQKLQEEIAGITSSNEKTIQEITQRNLQHLQEKDTQIEKLHKEQQRKNEELTQCVIIIKKLEEQIENKDSELKTHTAEIQSIRKQVENEKLSSEQYVQEINKLKLLAGDFERKNQTQEEKMLELTQQKTHLENEIKTLMGSSGDFSAKLKEMTLELRRKDEKFESTRNDLNEKLEKSERNLQETQLSLQKVQQDFERTRNEYEEKLKHLSEAEGNQKEQNQNFVSEANKIRDELLQKVTELENTLNRKDLELKSKTDASSECNRVLQEQCKKLEEEHKKLCENSQKIQEEKRIEAENQIRKLVEEFKQKELELEQSHKKEIQNINENTSKHIDELQKSNISHELQIKEKEESINKLMSELENIKKLEETTKKSEYESVMNEITHKEQEITKLRSTIGDFEKEIQNLQVEKQNFTVKETQLNELQNNFNAATKKLENSEKTTQKLQAYETLLKMLQLTENQKKNLITTVENSPDSSLISFVKNIKIDAKEEENKRILELEIALKETESKLKEARSSMETNQIDVRNLQDELFKAQERLNELQQQTDVGKPNTAPNTNYNNHQQLLEEKKLIQGQVEFLNSIIVDMQKKNKEQQMRIEILESGFSPAAAEELHLYKAGERQLAPRMYCDICEEFDLHETEDCPQQTSDDIPASHTSDTKEKPPPRPYCDICEIFGHNTEDCKDDQTF